MAVRQHALTVVAPVRASERPTLAERLDAVEGEVKRALATVSTLHFARFVLLEGPDGAHARLAFESNHDGEVGPHLDALASALAPFEALLFGAWEGYRTGQLASFVAKHRVPEATFYLGHRGLSVEQILNDRDLHLELERQLDEDDASAPLAGQSASAVRQRLVDRIAETKLTTGRVERDLPAQPASTILWYVIVAFVAFAAVFVLPFALFIEWRERRSEPPRELAGEDDPRIAAINLREDASAQNGLTHHVPLRPGSFRFGVVRLVLWFIERTHGAINYSGSLGGITSIHFARWVLLDDDTILFFSNYDGSLESYLGDFVDRARFFLSAVWTNAKWFPDTHALVFGGASKEASFKRWTRTFQVENRIWYSAYENLSVSDVLRNDALREGAKGPMTEEQARAWLARL